MKQNHLSVFLAAGLIMFLVVAACTTQEKAKHQGSAREGTGTPQETTLQGMIRIYGNEPHTWVGIRTPEGKIYAVSPPEKAAELRTVQGRLLEFTVTIQDTFILGVEGAATVLSWRYVR